MIVHFYIELNLSFCLIVVNNGFSSSLNHWRLSSRMKFATTKLAAQPRDMIMTIHTSPPGGLNGTRGGSQVIN